MFFKSKTLINQLNQQKISTLWSHSSVIGSNTSIYKGHITYINHDIIMLPVFKEASIMNLQRIIYSIIAQICYVDWELNWSWMCKYFLYIILITNCSHWFTAPVRCYKYSGRGRVYVNLWRECVRVETLFDNYKQDHAYKI